MKLTRKCYCCLIASLLLAYTVALALRCGHVDLDDFAPAKVLGDASILALAQRVKVKGRKIPAGEPALRQPVTVRVIQFDGTIVELTSSQLRGTPQRPLSTPERNAKLTDAANGALSSNAIEALQVSAGTIEQTGIESKVRINILFPFRIHISNSRLLKALAGRRITTGNSIIRSLIISSKCGKRVGGIYVNLIPHHAISRSYFQFIYPTGFEKRLVAKHPANTTSRKPTILFVSKIRTHHRF